MLNNATFFSPFAFVKNAKRWVLAALLSFMSMWATLSQAQTTVLDSIAIDDVTSYTVSATDWRGPTFQTGAIDTRIYEVSFRLVGEGVPATATLSLYNLDGATDVPTGTPLVSVTINYQYVTGNSVLATYGVAQLGAIATTTLAAGQKYGLILSAPSSTTGLLDNDSPGAAYTLAGGFSAAGGGYAQTTNSGATWVSNGSVTPSFQLKVIPFAAAPTPTPVPALNFGAMLLMALLLLGLARQRLR